MKFIPILAFYLNDKQLQLHHKQFATVTQITRRNTMHKYTRSILVIHRVALAGFEDEPPETEQTDAQKSEFTDSTGLFKDHLFPHFHPSGAL
jgi:hypothetical protein